MLKADNKKASKIDLKVGQLPDKVRLILLSVLVGIFAGAGAFILKWIIGHITMLLRPVGMNAGGSSGWLMLIIPVAGIVLTGIYQRYILRREIFHGVDRLVSDLSAHNYNLSPQLTYSPIVASSITLGFGGSAGSEGPIAYAGAAIGSNVGRLFRLTPQSVYILIGCGAAAGIAGIFKAPIGGVLFSIEVLMMDFTTISVIALFGAAISAALTAYVLSGCTMDMLWSHNLGFDSDILPEVIALAVFCGLYSIYYSTVMKRMAAIYMKFRNPWIRNILSGVVLAACVYLFPSLYGEGYGVMAEVINSQTYQPFVHSLLESVYTGSGSILFVLGLILVLKCFAASASNSGGGVAGDFAPTLFAGCIAGAFFALSVNSLFGLSLSSEVFAYIGMAGVMAGTIRAPLMALFLTAEMCNGFDYFLPLVVVTLVSYGMVMAVTKCRFYIGQHEGKTS